MKFTLHKPKFSSSDCYACIISGDGLRTSLTDFIAARLAKRGIAAARVKAIQYFWSKRSPKLMSSDLQRYMIRRIKLNSDAKFIFIGYSFGAGTLPFALNLMPETLRARILNVVLIAPPAEADFEFFFRSWMHKTTTSAQKTAPEIEKILRTIPILYLHGEDDYVGAREDLAPNKNLQIISLPGGHDFDKDYEVLFKKIQASLDELACDAK